MLIKNLEEIVTDGITRKSILEVIYIRKDDGFTTCRLMEPYDVNAGKRSKTRKLMFWGWCLTHNHIEQKLPENIISIATTSKNFIPRIFPTKPNYRIPRRW